MIVRALDRSSTLHRLRDEVLAMTREREPVRPSAARGRTHALANAIRPA
jgi:hypothetical protein